MKKPRRAAHRYLVARAERHPLAALSRCLVTGYTVWTTVLDVLIAEGMEQDSPMPGAFVAAEKRNRKERSKTIETRQTKDEKV